MYILERPSMAINDPRVSSGGVIRRFQLWNTWDITQNESRQHIIAQVAAVARSAPGGRLRNLVLSCHGAPAYLQLGEGFYWVHLPLFDAWRGLIQAIWFPDCLVARIPDAALRLKFGEGIWDGNRFCSELAQRVQCSVVAPTELQIEMMATVPVDMMTHFEGLVLFYGPDGNITWSGRFPSAGRDATGLWHGNAE